MAKSYYTDGKIDKVIFHWTEVIRLQPDNTEVLNNLAWLHAATRDPAIQNPPLALEYASRACELTDSRHANYVDTLALAYAADGQFNLAIETALKALELALTDGNEKLVDEINQHLQLYKANKPYYDNTVLINQ